MKLSYIKNEYFEDLLSLEIDPLIKNKLISDMCRINILYMICCAGSGHIGSSFSSIDLMNWIIGELDKKYENLYFFSSKGHDAPALYNSLIAHGKLDFSYLMLISLITNPEFHHVILLCQKTLLSLEFLRVGPEH